MSVHSHHADGGLFPCNSALWLGPSEISVPQINIPVPLQKLFGFDSGPYRPCALLAPGFECPYPVIWNLEEWEGLGFPTSHQGR